MTEESWAGKAEQDLVIATIPGVQRFVAESRRTADLFASSDIMSELAGAMVGAVAEPAELVLPGARDIVTGIPNRVVALTGAGDGRKLAQAMADAVRDAWAAIRIGVNAEETPGFPVVQWVVVPPCEGGYDKQWDRAQNLLAERKRVRDFAFPPMGQNRVCTLTGRWPAAEKAPRGSGVKRGEHLSAIGRIKRVHVRGRFPSTWSIGSAPYREDLIRLADTADGVRSKIEDLREAISLLADSGRFPHLRDGLNGDLLSWFRMFEGAWCVPETWDPETLRREHALTESPDVDICHIGREAARDLQSVARKVRASPLTSYLAVLAQDADKLGESLSDRTLALGPMQKWHSQVSAALERVGPRQRKAVESPGLGRVVYSGGDDLLALVPLASATAIARDSFDAFREEMAGPLPRATVSTALVFFHASWPLQSAVAGAQELLKEAKQRSRPGLAVAVQHRGGERARWVTPWQAADGRQALDHLQEMVSAMKGTGELSARLAMSLERDRSELATLTPEWLHLELTRRAVRHGIPEAAMTALRGLCAQDGDGVSVPVDALLVARFLAAEGSR